MELKYITYQNIDKVKWDNCVTNATNHLIYAESWYLDIVCPEKWNALVLNDYEAVMPLPLKSKMGLSYVQQPIWTQQLGLFSKAEITPDLIENFLKAIPKKMAMVSLNINENNFIDGFDLAPKTNLILELNNTYEELKTNFSSNTKRNSNKAAKADLTTELNSTDVTGFINFFKTYIQNPISDYHYNTLQNLVEYSVNNDKGFIALVKQNDEIIAASFILKANNRLIYRTGTSNPKGKEVKAMFLLVNELIQQYANTNYQLDFEGSELEGVARFYKGFGAKNTPYYYYKKYNNKLLKVLYK
ncbi:MAG: GNAT family N-acetyltransferase [Vicingaceae bacterium]